MLQDAQVIGQPKKVVQAKFRIRERRDGQRLGFLHRQIANEMSLSIMQLGAGKAFQVTLRYLRPDHLPTIEIGALTHSVPLRFIFQKVDHLLGDRRRISKRHQDAPVLRQQLLSIPVGRRDDRSTGAHRVCQRTGHDLRLV